MDLSDIFTALDINIINEYISSQQEENLHLDFKLVKSPQLTKDDRKLIAKCFSAFANSSGGIVVWGVDARKNEHQIDCAVGKIPIPRLSLFISRITSITGEVVDPIVDGIIHKRILEGEDSGFAATLIPMSFSGPHMAKAGEDRYYKRSGDSFYKMEHFDLEDMFGRRRKPLLGMDYKVSFTHFSKNPHFSECTLIILLSITNTGRGSAKAPYLSIRVNDPFNIYPYGIDGNRGFGLPQLTRARGRSKHSYGGSSNFVIHPNTSLDVTSISTKITITDSEISLKNDLEIEYSLGAEDISLKEGKINISTEEIVKSLPSSA